MNALERKKNRKKVGVLQHSGAREENIPGDDILENKHVEVW